MSGTEKELPRFRGHVVAALETENASLREQLKQRDEVIKELIPIAEERLDDLNAIYHQTKDETVQEHGKKIDSIIRKAKNL